MLEILNLAERLQINYYNGEKNQEIVISVGKDPKTDNKFVTFEAIGDISSEISIHFKQKSIFLRVFLTFDEIHLICEEYLIDLYEFLSFHVKFSDDHNTPIKLEAMNGEEITIIFNTQQTEVILTQVNKKKTLKLGVALALLAPIWEIFEILRQFNLAVFDPFHADWRDF